MPFRFVTQDLLSRQVWVPDVPLTGGKFMLELDGSGALTGVVTPRFPDLRMSYFAPGKTAIYVESGSGELVWGGIVWGLHPNGPELGIEAAGFTSWLWRRNVDRDNAGRAGPWIEADVLDVVRALLAWTQTIPTRSVQITPDLVVSGTLVGTTEEPYAITRSEAPKVGEEIANLARQVGGFEWSDQVTGTLDAHTRWLRLGPRLGRRRTDVSLRSGYNVVTAPPSDVSADDYANHVIVLGAGEGVDRISADASISDGYPQLDKVVDLPHVQTLAQAQAAARAEIARSRVVSEVSDVVVSAGHPETRLGTLDIGDEVMAVLRDQWTDIEGWVRITRIAVDCDAETVTLTVERV